MSRVIKGSLGIFLTAVLGLYSAPVGAEPITALTVQNQLIFFDSLTPGSVSAPISISGVVSGDMLVGIDRRPSLGSNNGVLYSVGVSASGSGRVYSVNEATGVATAVSTLAADPTDLTAPFPFTTVQGVQFGIDFNPTVDRLRLTSDTGQNLRINVDNGLTQLDGPLAYEAGDPRAGMSPADVAVAYSNNFGGATTTVLRGVDIASNPDTLVLHSNPNGGALQTIVSLPFNGMLVSYDISGLTGTPYFAVTPAGAATSQLFALGMGGTTLVGGIGGGSSIRGIAAPVGTPVPEPASITLVATGIAAALHARRRRRARMSTPEELAG